MKRISLILVVLMFSFSLNAQDIQICFNKNIEFFGYLIEMGDSSDNDPSHPIFKIIHSYPTDKENPILSEIFTLGENIDYTTIVNMFYYIPEFPIEQIDHSIEKMLQERGYSQYYDKQKLLRLLDLTNQYYKSSSFEKVWNALVPFQQETIKTLNKRKPKPEFIQEIEAFYEQSFEDYEIVPSLTLWQAGWGIRTLDYEKATFIMGPLDKNYDFTSDRFTSLAIHEFGHSFVNHIVIENTKVIDETSELFAEIASSMTRQGYSNWISCVIEHFVRAGEVIIPEIMGDLTRSQTNLKYYIEDRDFIYLDYLVNRLKEYRLNKKLSYSVAIGKTLKDFQNKFQPKKTQIGIVKGVVSAAESNEPIPFAHIGVPGKNLGTISKIDGSYEIDLSKASPKDSLVFSSIGFKRAVFPISKLTTYNDVSLIEDVTVLDEVVITNEKRKFKIEKFGRTKPSKTTRGQNGLKEFGYGGEQGIRVNVKEEYYLEEVGFHLRFNTVDSILFRINIYDIDEDGLPGNSLLNRNIFVKSKKGQKWIRKELESESLIIDQDIIITYEVVQVWFNKNSNNAIYLTHGKEYPEGGVYLRRSSMDQWITKEPDAFPITLYVSGKVY